MLMTLFLTAMMLKMLTMTSSITPTRRACPMPGTSRSGKKFSNISR